jgi:hypothetical protein
MTKILKLASFVLALSSAASAFSAPIVGKIFIGSLGSAVSNVPAPAGICDLR